MKTHKLLKNEVIQTQKLNIIFSNTYIVKSESQSLYLRDLNYYNN